MSTDGYRQADIICPFFKSENAKKHRITCEGPTDVTSIALMFHNAEADRLKHIEIFCENHYQYCEIYRAVQQAKYDEGE